MSQTVIDRPPQAPMPVPEMVTPRPVAPVYQTPAAQPIKSDVLSTTALICAIVGIGVSSIPLFLVNPSVAVVVALVGPGLLFGIVAALVGAFGLVRAARKGFATLSLIVGVASLAWTIFALIDNVGNAIR